VNSVHITVITHTTRHSRSRYNTPTVWTKWNGACNRHVDFNASEGSLRRHA